MCLCRLPVRHLSHPELFGQNGDGPVPRQNRPQLAVRAGRLHICQGKHERAAEVNKYEHVEAAAVPAGFH